MVVVFKGNSVPIGLDSGTAEIILDDRDEGALLTGKLCLKRGR